MISILFLLFTIIGVHCQEVDVISVDDPNNITIAFGSCNNVIDEDENMRQVFTSIAQTQPNIWMWIGDAVYLDGDSFFFGSLPGPGYDTADEQFVRDMFTTLKNNEAYSSLVNSVGRVIGTWDDHDYGYDSANKTFEYKERNKGIYLDFLETPENDTRRNRSGIYTSYYVGEEKLIKIILLDCRYNRDEESTAANVLDTDTTETFDDMLGEDQWTWLDNQLDDENATYTLIVSPTQYLPDDRPILPNWFDNSRERLLDMIRGKQKSGVVLISGDVHFAEIVTHPCPGRVGYNAFYEFTSSGMTHSASFVDIFDGVVETYSAEDDRYFERNFALIKLVRGENTTDVPNLVFEARDADGNVVLTREVSYADLTYNETQANNYNGCQAIENDSDEEGGSEEDDNIGDDLSNVGDDIGNGVGDAVDDVGNAADEIGNIFNKAG